MQSDLEKQFTYQSPNANQIERMRTIREAALEFVREIDIAVPNSADKSAAIRKVREAVMTANAAIVLE